MGDSVPPTRTSLKLWVNIVLQSFKPWQKQEQFIPLNPLGSPSLSRRTSWTIFWAVWGSCSFQKVYFICKIGFEKNTQAEASWHFIQRNLTCIASWSISRDDLVQDSTALVLLWTERGCKLLQVSKLCKPVDGCTYRSLRQLNTVTGDASWGCFPSAIHLLRWRI